MDTIKHVTVIEPKLLPSLLDGGIITMYYVCVAPDGQTWVVCPQSVKWKNCNVENIRKEEKYMDLDQDSFILKDHF